MFVGLINVTKQSHVHNREIIGIFFFYYLSSLNG